MTNYDYYIDDIMDYIGIDKNTGSVVECNTDLYDAKKEVMYHIPYFGVRWMIPIK